MSSHDNDFDDRLRREMNFDDFERLDNYSLHEQPEAEERESGLIDKDAGERTDGHYVQQHEQRQATDSPSSAAASADDLLLNFGEGNPSSSLPSSIGLHSTARPLVTAGIEPPALQVCPKPVPEAMEIHLTPDPDENRAAEPFVNIAADDERGSAGYDPDEIHRKYFDLDPDNEDDLYPPTTLVTKPSAPEPSLLFDPPNAGGLYTRKEDDDAAERSFISEVGAGDLLLQEFGGGATSSIISQPYPIKEPENIIGTKEPSNLSENKVIMEDVQPKKQQQGGAVDVQEDMRRPEEPFGASPPRLEHGRKLNEEGGGRCPFRFCAWFKPENLDPRVADLLYWRDVKKTGVAFGSGLLLLLSLTCFSLISVVAYLLLAVMVGTLSYRIYKNVLQAVQKSGDGHPFKAYLDFNLSLPRDRLHDAAEVTVKHVECTAQKLRRLFLVEDLVDSIKFLVMLWCFTYVGAWFNGLTLFILGYVAVFTLPKFYENYKTEIDHYVNIASTQVNDALSKVKAKIPIGKKQKEQ